MAADSGTVLPLERVLGIPFFTGTVGQAVTHLSANGGYLVIPAGPALIKLNYDEDYRRAMESADLALADSGLLVLVARLATGRKLSRISGIDYFKHLFEHGGLRTGQNSFWVFASQSAKEKAAAWVRRRGFGLEEKDSFVARTPGSSSQDYEILSRIEEEKPADVIIAMAGGNQEKLALYLRDYLLYRPAIHCIGAALNFLSGEEKAMPDWAQRTHLGWLLRLVAQPRMILPRIGIAFSLAAMIFKYRCDLPPLKKRWADI